MREGVRKVNIVVVLHGGDVSLLVRVLIERTILLFSIPSFQTVMRRSHTHECVCVGQSYNCGKIWHSYNMYISPNVA